MAVSGLVAILRSAFGLRGPSTFDTHFGRPPHRCPNCRLATLVTRSEEDVSALLLMDCLRLVLGLARIRDLRHDGAPAHEIDTAVSEWRAERDTLWRQGETAVEAGAPARPCAKAPRPFGPAAASNSTWSPISDGRLRSIPTRSDDCVSTIGRHFLGPGA